jgi:hypothetical protein
MFHLWYKDPSIRYLMVAIEEFKASSNSAGVTRAILAAIQDSHTGNTLQREILKIALSNLLYDFIMPSDTSNLQITSLLALPKQAAEVEQSC